MEFALKEYEKKNNKKVKVVKKEKIPDWFNQEAKEELLSDEELRQFESELGR